MERGKGNGDGGRGTGNGGQGTGDGGQETSTGNEKRARCNWPQLLRCPCQRSLCLFVCFFSEANKIKLKIKRRIGKEVSGGVGVQVSFCIQVFIFPVPFSSPLL